MQQDDYYSKQYLIDKIKSYDHKDLENEYLGFDYHKPYVEEKKRKIPKPKIRKRLGVFVTGIYYSTLAEAAKALNINRYTLSDWLNGRQRPDMKEKLNLKKERSEED